MRDIAILVLVPLTVAVISSMGVGAIIIRVLERKYELADRERAENDAMERMLIGLAHDRIIDLGMTYIERGWLTDDEYENLHSYLFEPYEELGGNGTAKKVMKDVSNLEIKRGGYVSEDMVQE